MGCDMDRPQKPVGRIKQEVICVKRESRDRISKVITRDIEGVRSSIESTCSSIAEDAYIGCEGDDDVYIGGGGDVYIERGGEGHVYIRSDRSPGYDTSSSYMTDRETNEPSKLDYSENERGVSHTGVNEKQSFSICKANGGGIELKDCEGEGYGNPNDDTAFGGGIRPVNSENNSNLIGGTDNSTCISSNTESAPPLPLQTSTDPSDKDPYITIKGIFTDIANDVVARVSEECSIQIQKYIMNALDVDVEELTLHPSLEQCLQRVVEVTERMKECIVRNAIRSSNNDNRRKRGGYNDDGSSEETARPVKKRARRADDDGEVENDKRRTPMPIKINWTKCPEGTEIDVKEISWNPFHKGHRVSYNNPMLDCQITRYFSSRRYKGKPQSLDAANEFVQQLKVGLIPINDSDFIDAQA